MSATAHWVRLTECSTGLEADILRATLESANIPVQLKSNQAGIFGAAFQGAVTGGIEVLVPSPMAERAQIILDESSPSELGADEDSIVDDDNLSAPDLGELSLALGGECCVQAAPVHNDSVMCRARGKNL